MPPARPPQVTREDGRSRPRPSRSAEVLAVERQIVPVEPHLAEKDGNWEIEFFDSDRYNAARNHRAPQHYAGE